MASNSFWAYGSVLQLGNGATPEVFTNIAEITSLTPPKAKRDSDEVSNYASPDAYREFIPTWRDGGEVAVEANWLPNDATQDENTGILANFNDNVNHNWKILLPNSIATIAFAGHVVAFEPDLPLDGHGKLAFTIKVSGKAVLS